MTPDLDTFLDDVNRSQLGWRESLVATYDLTRDLLSRGVPGDLVECGVGAGCHPAVMARACIDAGETRTVRLFDSFQGLPHGGPRDTDWNKAWGDGSGRLEATGVAAHLLNDVRQNFNLWTDNYKPVAYHAGWFQNTVPHYVTRDKNAPDWPELQREPSPIALLRLDGDLYDSTMTCLTHLYPLVSSGGVCVVDDLNLEGCRAAVTDFGLDLGAFTMITESGDGWIRKP